jgi:hypothetical protein
MRLTPPVLFALAGLAGTARAAESPRFMAVELRFGFYQPAVDRQFVSATPYQDIFGDDPMFMFGVHLDYQLWQEVGTIGIGGSWHYGFVDGHSVDESHAATADETALNLMPLNLTASYRFDYLAQRFDVPLVPYVKVGLTGAYWWVTDGSNNLATTTEGTTARPGQGFTFGWHVGAGLQFLLDVLSTRMSNQIDEDVGINNSYLYGEWMMMNLNDFGADDSIDLTDLDWWSFGLMFEF